IRRVLQLLGPHEQVGQRHRPDLWQRADTGAEPPPDVRSRRLAVLDERSVRSPHGPTRPAVRLLGSDSSCRKERGAATPPFLLWLVPLAGNLQTLPRRV